RNLAVIAIGLEEDAQRLDQPALVGRVVIDERLQPELHEGAGFRLDRRMGEDLVEAGLVVEADLAMAKRTHAITHGERSLFETVGKSVDGRDLADAGAPAATGAAFRERVRPLFDR